MDVTTVGSNIIAITPTGRILSVLLAALGMMMFPIFTVYVTSLVQSANKKKEDYYNQTHPVSSGQAVPSPCCWLQVSSGACILLVFLSISLGIVPPT